MFPLPGKFVFCTTHSVCRAFNQITGSFTLQLIKHLSLHAVICRDCERFRRETAGLTRYNRDELSHVFTAFKMQMLVQHVLFCFRNEATKVSAGLEAIRQSKKIAHFSTKGGTIDLKSAVFNLCRSQCTSKVLFMFVLTSHEMTICHVKMPSYRTLILALQLF